MKSKKHFYSIPQFLFILSGEFQNANTGISTNDDVRKGHFFPVLCGGFKTNFSKQWFSSAHSRGLCGNSESISVIYERNSLEFNTLEHPFEIGVTQSILLQTKAFYLAPFCQEDFHTYCLRSLQRYELASTPGSLVHKVK